MPLIYGEGENAFVRLRKEIDRVYKTGTKHRRLSAELPVAHQAAFNSRYNQHASTCLKGTREDLLRDIIDWIDGTDKRSIFWLNGIAGTGKSTIARTIARWYHGRETLGGSFFFSTRGEMVGAADRLFTTLASQLSTCIPAVERHISKAINDNPEIADHSLRDQWEQLIVGPLSKLTQSSATQIVVFVIDSLNECENDRDIQYILRLLSMCNKLQNVRVRILITSRPDISVRCGFHEIPESERETFVLQNISRTIVDRDLNLFFEENFRIIRDERGFAAEWPGSHIIENLVELSCGLFLWAAIACRFIREGKKFAKRRIWKLLNDHGTDGDPGKQLDEIYITVLTNSLPVDTSEEEKQSTYESLAPLRQVLGSIAILYSPLSSRALASLLSVPAEDIEETLADLHTVLSVPTERDLPIHLHHPTFREFIVNKQRCPDQNFSVDEQETHLALAQNCIYLMSRTLKRDICGLGSSGTTIDQVSRQRIEDCIPPQLQYALLYWVQHFRRSGTRLREGDNTHEFFQRNFLFWLEAITLIGKSSEIGSILRMYASLIQSEKNLSHIPFVHHARQFFLASPLIIEHAPLQIYCAALIFSRPFNQLRNHFWGQILPWIKHVRVVQGNGPEAKEEYNYVNDLAFTPDGRHLASGSTNAWVRLWNVKSKAPLTKYEGQTDKVSSVAMSPDGRLLASGSDDSTVMVWDTESRTVRNVLQGHKRWVNTVVFSNDGKFLASGSMDETVRLWDTQSGKELAVLEPNMNHINSLAFSPDCSWLAAGTGSRLIPIWNLESEDTEIKRVVDGHLGPVNSVHFSPNGKRIVSGSDDRTVRVWDTATGGEIMVLKGHKKKIWAVALSKDASIIASGSEDKSIRLWNARTGDLVSNLVEHTSGVNAVSYSPDGRYLASGSFNDEVYLWDVKSGGGLHGKFGDFEEEKKLGITGLSREAAQDDDLRGHKSMIACLTLSLDRLTVASGSHDGTVKLWSTRGDIHHTLEGHSGEIISVVFSPSGEVIASSSMDATIKLWESSSGALLQTLDDRSGPVRKVRFSPDGQFLASCSAGNQIRLWEVNTGALCTRLQGHDDVVNDIAFSFTNNDKLLVSCSADHIAKLRHIPSGDSLAVLRGHSSPVTSVEFSPDGQLIISGSEDGNILIWDRAGRSRSTLGGHRGHHERVNSACISVDNKTAISCSNDKTVRIWDIETGSVKDQHNCGTVVRRVGFSDCGRFIDTDRGLLRYDAHLMKLSVELFSSDKRVMTKAGDEIWIPKDYQATSVTASETTIIMGHAKGSLLFIGV